MMNVCKIPSKASEGGRGRRGGPSRGETLLAELGLPAVLPASLHAQNDPAASRVAPRCLLGSTLALHSRSAEASSDVALKCADASVMYRVKSSMHGRDEHAPVSMRDRRGPLRDRRGPHVCTQKKREARVSATGVLVALALSLRPGCVGMLPPCICSL